MKKLISMFLVILIVYSITTFTASASVVSGEDTVVAEYNISLDEELNSVLNSTTLSDKQKSDAITKINFIKQINTYQYEDRVYTMATTYNCTVAIPYFKQSNSYYCGPATTKQSLHYLTGSSPSQATIAQALGTTTAGTDGANIVTYLNQNQSSIYYMAVYPTSQASMETLIYRGLTSYGTAPILRVKMTTSQGWKYASAGHFMNVSGQYTVSGATRYQVTDSYIEYKVASETDGKYNISSTAVYNSTINHFAQRFYY